MPRLIDADALVERLEKSHEYHARTSREEVLLARDIRIIKEQPTIDAEPVRHGRWIMRGGKRYCSYCNKRACVTRDREDFWYTVGTEYCPTCGAIMDGGVSDEG